MSATLNNKAIQIYLNLPDIAGQDRKDKKLNQMKQILKEATEIAPYNAVALLNKYLLSWQMGEIRDDEF